MLLEQEYDGATEPAVSVLEDIAELDEFCARAEMRAAIAAMRFDSLRQLDCRHLWSAGPFNYFRVNRWSGSEPGVGQIRNSAFVRVEKLPHGWRIRELSGTQTGRFRPDGAAAAEQSAERGWMDGARSPLGTAASLDVRAVR
jgi:hypothetical protein